MKQKTFKEICEDYEKELIEAYCKKGQHQFDNTTSEYCLRCEERENK